MTFASTSSLFLNYRHEDLVQSNLISLFYLAPIHFYPLFSLFITLLYTAINQQVTLLITIDLYAHPGAWAILENSVQQEKLGCQALVSKHIVKILIGDPTGFVKGTVCSLTTY